MFKKHYVDAYIRVEMKVGKWPHETFFEYLSASEQVEYIGALERKLREVRALIERHVDVDYIDIRTQAESRCEFCDEPESGSIDTSGEVVCCQQAWDEWRAANPAPEMFEGTQESLDALTIRGGR